MVKQQRRSDRCFRPAAGNSVAQVQFPVCPVQRRQRWVGTGTGGADQLSTTTEEERGAQETDGALRETESKKIRVDRYQEAAALTGRDKVLELCGEPANSDQQEAAETSEDSRAAELQGVGSLKVTIQHSTESREFGQTDRTADRQTGGLHCHVCKLICRSLQVFQEHMSGPEHLRKLQEITQSICLSAPTVQDRGRRPDTRRWCDTCQTHFSCDVITHRQTKQHKMCKKLCRPFCPVCERHFRTPRKFVEHMKSPEHKQQVQLVEAQEEELITVDAVGCFEGEEEEEEEEVDVADDEDKDMRKEAEETMLETAESEETCREFDPHTTYGASFVVPVSGFLCRLCNKFFFRETTARHTHCKTHTHYVNLQRLRSQRTNCD